ncbi:MAG: hypothetical protein JXA07_03100 [Spirochaetes bacterium]|nr:hypothetical protein [Spirochaetota bacterium]
MSGWVGKIVRINLTTKKISYINTSDYEEWIGGHGMGAKIFYDIMIEKGVDLESMDHNSPTDGGFSPDNVVSIMTSPFTGTGVPAATGRTEVQGMGVQQYPIGWYTKSLFGGRFGPMVKFAGYDGIVIEGAASEPVWIDIRDSDINIRKCSELGLWGKDTVEAQKLIWDYVVGDEEYGTWISPEGLSGRTTQRPAVLTMGRAGENKCRFACLIHDMGNCAGAGGFGAVFGSKNLKAVSVIGSGGIPVADPAGIVKERLSNLEEYAGNINNFTIIDRIRGMLRHPFLPGAAEAYGKTPTNWDNADFTSSLRNENKGPSSCMGCYGGCRARYQSGLANESKCAGTYFYAQADSKDIMVQATDLVNRYGFNTFDFYQGVPYLKALADQGVIGKGCEIDCGDLDWSTFGSIEFAQEFLRTIAERETEFGDAVAEGFYRALDRWGRLDDIGDASEEDMAHIPLPYWGLPEHHYDARAQLDYGFGSILGDRETCEHYFTSIYWDNYWHEILYGLKPLDANALQSVTLTVEKMLPHASDYASQEEAMQMMNYSTENMYSEHIARLVSWDRHCTRFFKASLIMCDWRFPDIINYMRDDKRGSSFTSEERFIKAVTGKDLSYLDCMEIGRKIWNLDNVIWTLQGRHRDMVYFADYIYRDTFEKEWKMTTYDASESTTWAFRDCGNRKLDRDEFDNFKTRFYAYEGWDTKTGWPTRSTLEDLGLKEIADTLESRGKLGSN